MSAAMAFPETDDYTTSSALGEAEISRLIKTAQAAQFVARDGVPKKTESDFKPRSLVEIAFAAEKVRQDAQKSHDQNNISQATVAQNGPAAQNLPSSSHEQTGSTLPGLGEPVADVPQISEEQATINAFQAQHEADMTALRAELAVRQQLAEKQAYERGVTAGIEAAKSAEPSEEERALDERRQAEHRDVIARLEACITSAAGPDAVDEQQLATALQTAVMHLASERAGIVISENPEGIIARIVSLAERVKQKSEIITVALNSEDFKALTAYETGPPGWKYVADEALLSGDVRISLDTIDISDVLLSDVPQVREDPDLSQAVQDVPQVKEDPDLSQAVQDVPQVKEGPQEFKILTTSTDGEDEGLTPADQDLSQVGVDEVPLEFKIVTTSSDEDAE